MTLLVAALTMVCASAYALSRHDIEVSSGVWIGATLGVSGVAITVLLFTGDRAASLTGASAAVAVALLAPSLVGEQSSRAGIALLLMAAVGARLRSGRATMSTGRPLLFAPLALVVLYWVSTLLVGANAEGNELQVAAYFILGGVAFGLFGNDRSTVSGLLKVFAISVAILGWSWLLTWLTLHVGFDVQRLQLTGKALGRPGFDYQFHLPLTLTSGNNRLEGLHRNVGLTGEPGLYVIQCALAIAAATILLPRGPLRALIVSGGLVGLLSAQSTAGLVCAPIAMGVALILKRGRLRGRLSLGLLCVLGIGLLMPVAWSLIVNKAADNPASLEDRGFGFAGGSLGTTGASSRISLLASVPRDGWTVLLVLMALLVLVWLSRWHLVVCGSMVYTAMLAVFSQPLPYQLGIFVVAVALVAVPVLARSPVQDSSARLP